MKREVANPGTSENEPPSDGRRGRKRMQADTNYREDVFSLQEGNVSIQWPSSLSRESYQDLADWLEILKRKIGRSVQSEESEQKN